MTRPLVALICWALFVAAGSPADGGDAANSPVDADVPGVRNGHVMAYDAAGGFLLLFGGASEKEVLGDSWAWSAPDGWRRLSTSGPAPRTFPAMAAAPGLGGVYLFGGNRVLFGSGEDGTTLDDFWRWRDGRWQRLISPIRGPAARAEAAMAYDAANNRLVLFGGYRREGGALRPFGDSWAFDGAGWHELTDAGGPVAQSGAAMAYDPAAEKVTLVARNADRSASLAWRLEGDRWQQVGQPVAPRRYLATLARDPVVGDPVAGGLMLFGGWTGEGRSDETLVWSGGAWRRAVADPHPAARNHAAMAYNPASNRALLYGGHDGENVFGDLWAWDGAAWTLIGEAPAKARVDNGH